MSKTLRSVTGQINSRDKYKVPVGNFSTKLEKLQGKSETIFHKNLLQKGSFLYKF